MRGGMFSAKMLAKQNPSAAAGGFCETVLPALVQVEVRG